mmetsp:Transcript_21115/g.44347  ORF Transcript_21115/g.44347 Transcript_21115/m.44347 type:complete len:82 (+) Transcript_21115:140-385(+)
MQKVYPTEPTAYKAAQQSPMEQYTVAPDGGVVPLTQKLPFDHQTVLVGHGPMDVIDGSNDSDGCNEGKSDFDGCDDGDKVG